MRLSEQIDALARLTIFAQLGQQALVRLAQSCAWRNYAAHEQIVSYQDNSTDVAFLLAGKARAIIYSLEGKPVVFADLLPGSMFGEIAAIDGKGRSATVEAEQPCTVASLSADGFEKLMLSEPSVAIGTLRRVAADYRRLSERIFEFSTLAVRNRIHAELLRLASKFQKDGNEAVLSPSPSLSDIAYRISTHREAVSRELSLLISSGLLRREGGNLRITNLAKLEKMVHEARGD